MVSQKILNELYLLIRKKVCRTICWRGPKAFTENHKHTDLRPGKKPILDPFQGYILTLVFLRRCFQKNILADLFWVSQATVCFTINTWINVLYQVLTITLKWSSVETVKENLPPGYSEAYNNTRDILECTKIFSVRPSNVSAQASSYSNYNYHNTVKVLVCISPTGFFHFCVKCMWWKSIRQTYSWGGIYG